MGISEKLESSNIVYTLGPWVPGCLESRCLDSDASSLDKWTLGLKILKLHFTIKGEVADYDIFNSGVLAFQKTKAFLVESGRQGNYKFVTIIIISF